MKTKRLTLLALLTALALVLSYVESLLPPLTAVPGIKPGLGNLSVQLALYGLGVWPALALSAVRLTLSSLLFGTGMRFLAMALLKRTDRFSPVGVSVLGGVCHNLGQIAAALLLLETPAILGYLPVLLLTGTISGALIGLLGGWLLRRLKPFL